MKTSYSKLYLFFWKRPMFTIILSLLKGIMIGFFVCSLIGCVSKYQVVQKLRVNMYHLQHIKTKEIHIILSEKDLKEGDTIKLWQIPEIEFVGDDRPKYK